jgi:isopentenyldiphosphate isomerase
VRLEIFLHLTALQLKAYNWVFMSELFDIVNEDDEVIGQAPRSTCHGNPDLIHRAVHVLVVNRAGELLLQKRAGHKLIQPGRWDSSAGGHLGVGESYLAAGQREMREEIGVEGVPLTCLYASKIRNEIESENVMTYLARSEGPFRAEADEIDELRFWAAREIDAALGSGLLTPNFEDEWQMYQRFKRLYLNDEQGRLGVCAGDGFPDLIRNLD